MSKPRAAGLTLVLSALAACPGRLEDPDRFVGNNPGDGSVVSCTIGVANVESQLLRPRCATANCHDRAVHAGELDMASSGLSERLLGVMAAGCPGRVLITPGTGEGYLVDKLTSPQCGARMPLGSPAFSASELVCVRAWMMSLRVDAGAPMDVPVDTGPADVPRDVARDIAADRADARTDARIDAPDGTDDVPADALDLDAATDVTDAPDLDAAPDVVDAPEGVDAPDAPDVVDAGPRDVPRDVPRDAGADAPDVVDASDDAPTDA